MSTPQTQHKNYGKVPTYINKYNQQRENEIRQKTIDEENAKLPPGTRLMPEEERLSTLTDLIASKKATNDKLERLPIQIKSLKVAALKRELEDKMTRLERAIETFSKQKVYVKFWSDFKKFFPQFTCEVFKISDLYLEVVAGFSRGWILVLFLQQVESTQKWFRALFSLC